MKIDKKEPDSGYLRLEQQIAWYDKKSMHAQFMYKWTKVIEMISAVLIPVVAKINTTATALFGGVVIILESLQHMNQWSQNWNSYRSTCEALRHEKYTYMGLSGVYETKPQEEAKRILTQRVESLISTEHAKWISRQEYATRKNTNSENK